METIVKAIDDFNFLKLVSFKDFTLWDVKRYLKENDLSGFIELDKFLIPYKKMISRDKIISNKIQIISKINFQGELFLRDFEEIHTYKGNLFEVPPNHLIYSKINVRHGCVYFNTTGKTFAVSSEYPVYIIDEKKVIGEYVPMALRSSKIKEYLNTRNTGISKSRIKTDEFISTPIPLPSLSEQEAILAEYNAKMQEAIEVENNALKQFDVFQQKLIELLEIEIPTKVERIKNVLYFENLANLTRWDVWNSNVLPYSKVYDNVEFKEIVLSGPLYGANTKSAETNSDIRYLRITDINEDGSLNNEIVQAKDEDNKYLLEENDFLLARSGNTVGKSFLYKSKFGKCMFAGYLVKYKLDTEKVIPEYVFAYTKGIVFKEWIKSNQRISGQPNINGQEYLKSPFVLPDKFIQTKVVEEFKRRTENYYELNEQSKKLKDQAIKDFEAKIFKN